MNRKEGREEGKKKIREGGLISKNKTDWGRKKASRKKNETGLSIRM